MSHDNVAVRLSVLIWLLVAFALGPACKTSSRSGPTPLAGPGAGEDRVREITPEERRAFEDTVAVYEEQQAAGEVDLDDLRERFEQLVRRVPNVGEAWFNLGVIYERQGDIEKAEKAYVAALQQKPTLKVAAENLSVLFQNQGRVSDAVDILHQILTLYPEDASARARLADIYREQGDERNAASFARETLVRDPENAIAYRVLFHLAVAKREGPRARLLARKVLSLGGEDPEIYWELAKLDLADDDIEAATANLQRAAGLRPNYLPPRLVLAQRAMNEESWGTARQLYTEVLGHNPKMANVWLNLGVAHRGLGDVEKAEQAYKRALEIDPDESRALMNLGVLKMRAEPADVEGALQDFQRFVSMSRSLPRDHVVFGLIGEAEETIRLRAEMKRMEEEMRRMEEEEARRAEEEARRAEEQARLDAERAAEATDSEGEEESEDSHDHEDHSGEPDVVNGTPVS